MGDARLELEGRWSLQEVINACGFVVLCVCIFFFPSKDSSTPFHFYTTINIINRHDSMNESMRKSSKGVICTDWTWWSQRSLIAVYIPEYHAEFSCSQRARISYLKKSLINSPILKNMWNAAVKIDKFTAEISDMTSYFKELSWEIMICSSQKY